MSKDTLLALGGLALAAEGLRRQSQRTIRKAASSQTAAQSGAVSVSAGSKSFQDAVKLDMTHKRTQRRKIIQQQVAETVLDEIEQDIKDMTAEAKSELAAKIEKWIEENWNIKVDIPEDFTAETLTGIVAGAASAYLVYQYTGPLGPYLGPIAFVAGEWLGSNVGKYIDRAWDKLESWAGDGWDEVKTEINRLKNAAGDVWDKVGDAWDTVESGWEAVEDGLDAINPF